MGFLFDGFVFSTLQVAFGCFADEYPHRSTTCASVAHTCERNVIIRVNFFLLKKFYASGIVNLLKMFFIFVFLSLFILLTRKKLPEALDFEQFSSDRPNLLSEMPRYCCRLKFFIWFLCFYLKISTAAC